MLRMCREKMCRRFNDRNVSQRAPRVVLLCVVQCVAKYDTCDTFYFSVLLNNKLCLAFNAGIMMLIRVSTTKWHHISLNRDQTVM
jgi:hypothetical protein